MLRRMFQGSKPIAASTTPTRIDNKISRNATASGEPPRKRLRPSLAAGNSRVSLTIIVSRTRLAAHCSRYKADGKPTCRRQWLFPLPMVRDARPCRATHHEGPHPEEPALAAVSKDGPTGNIQSELKPSLPPSTFVPAFPAGRPRVAACPSAGD